MNNLNNKYFNCDCRSRRSPFSRNCGVSSQLLLGEHDPMSRVQTAHAQSTSCNLLARRDSGGAEGPAESRKVAACSRRLVAARFLSADWQFREAAGVELKGAGNGEAGPAQHACGEPSLSTRLCEFMTSWISPFVLLRRLSSPAGSGGGVVATSLLGAPATGSAGGSSAAGACLQRVPSRARRRFGRLSPRRSRQVGSPSARKERSVRPSARAMAPAPPPVAGEWLFFLSQGEARVAFHPHLTATRRWQFWHCHHSPLR